MKPAPNATWDLQLPPGSKNPLLVSSLRGKRNGFVPPSLRTKYTPPTGEDQQQKEIETIFDGPRGQESCSSLASSSTEPSCKDSSKKSTSSACTSPSVSSRKSASASSKSKRNSRKKSSSRSTRAPFDSTRKPRKSSIRKISESSPQKLPPRRQGSFYDIQIPGRLGTVKRQRSIMFNEQVYVRQFRSSLSLAKYDPRILWWQDDEHALIKENLQKLISRVDQHGVARRSGKKYCVRGLERFLDPENDYDGERIAAEEAVLHEQSLQRNSRTFDDLSIAAVYVRFAKASLRRSVRKGYEDAMDAASILKGFIGSSSLSLFRTSLSSGDLDVSQNRSALLKTSQLPKRSVSFNSVSRRTVPLRRKAQQQKQQAKQSTRSQAILENGPSVTSIA